MRAPVISTLNAKASVVLVRLRSLGDTVLATPAFSLLRRAMPRANIWVVLEERFAGVLEGQPDIDGVLRLPTSAGAYDKLRVVRAIRSKQPALCLDMHGGSTAAWMTALSGARFRAGFAHFRQRWAYNVRIPRAQEVLGRPERACVHTAEHHAAAVAHLSGSECAVPRARLCPTQRPSGPPYAVLHAGAAYATKRWKFDHFRAIALELRDQHGLEPVFVAGPSEDDPSGHAGDFAVRHGLRLPALMALLSGARLFVGNDSGPAHVAAAYGVPCVVVFGSSASAAWGPWKTAHRIVETEWSCKPCPGDRCYEYDRPRCILSVEREAVSRAVSELLEETGSIRSRDKSPNRPAGSATP